MTPESATGSPASGQSQVNHIAQEAHPAAILEAACGPSPWMGQLGTKPSSKAIHSILPQPTRGLFDHNALLAKEEPEAEAE